MERVATTITERGVDLGFVRIEGSFGRLKGLFFCRCCPSSQHPKIPRVVLRGFHSHTMGYPNCMVTRGTPISGNFLDDVESPSFLVFLSLATSCILRDRDSTHLSNRVFEHFNSTKIIPIEFPEIHQKSIAISIELRIFLPDVPVSSRTFTRKSIPEFPASRSRRSPWASPVAWNW